MDEHKQQNEQDKRTEIDFSDILKRRKAKPTKPTDRGTKENQYNNSGRNSGR
jgi:hypothetical protein